MKRIRRDRAILTEEGSIEEYVADGSAAPEGWLGGKILPQQQFFVAVRKTFPNPDGRCFFPARRKVSLTNRVTSSATRPGRPAERKLSGNCW
jgi:hypothetical protein